MNYFIRQSWLFFFTVTSSFHVSATTTLRLAYSDIESYPFQMGNGESVANPPGLALDVLNDVATKLELKIEYVRLPGKRVLDYIDTGKVDGGFIFSYNTLRAQYARYPMQDDSPIAKTDCHDRLLLLHASRSEIGLGWRENFEYRTTSRCSLRIFDCE